MKFLTRAELRLKSLGINNPQDIDILMIANDMNAKVKFRNLINCEAKIFGVNGKAIISVSETVKRVRQRFSIAHELGHWCFHQGRSFECRTEDIGSYKPYNNLDPERIADQYAVDLLMPEYLASPYINQLGLPNLKSSFSFSEQFRVSKVAGSIRAVHLSEHPSYLFKVSKTNQDWKVSNSELPYGLKQKYGLYKNISDRNILFDEDGLSPIFDENLYDWFDIEYNPDLFAKIQIYNSGYEYFLISLVCSSSYVMSCLWEASSAK